MEELGSCNTQNDIWAAKSLQSSITVEEFDSMVKKKNLLHKKQKPQFG